jgi:peptidoglycan/xylan/chitin deacetylase (PgdA/CDA1 family)
VEARADALLARNGSLASDSIWLRQLHLEAAYFTGRPWLAGAKTSGAGVILKFERVREPVRARFQPLKPREITPNFLDRTLKALKRWNYDIVSIDEACRRAVTLREPRRFVCLTFDHCYKDIIHSAHAVLALHGVPFTVYVPTAFPDGLGEPWWVALEDIIARESRVSLLIDRKERHFAIEAISDKYEFYEFLQRWIRSLAPPDLSFAINDLCRRYSVDLAALSRETFMDWSDIANLAADPRVTIGSATVNYPVLSSLKDSVAAREITMGKAVAEAALRREIRHFAYPYGDLGSWRTSQLAMVKQAGCSSAVTNVPGVVDTEGRTDLYALPRVAWDGRLSSLRAMRVLLSGSMFAPMPPPRTASSNS